MTHMCDVLVHVVVVAIPGSGGVQVKSSAYTSREARHSAREASYSGYGLHMPIRHRTRTKVIVIVLARELQTACDVLKAIRGIWRSRRTLNKKEMRTPLLTARRRGESPPLQEEAASAWDAKK